MEVTEKSRKVKFFTPRSQERDIDSPAYYDDKKWSKKDKNEKYHKTEKRNWRYTWEHDPYSNSKDLHEFLVHNPRSRILKRIEKYDLGDVCPCKDPERPEHSLLTALMENATNWDGIIMPRLDECLEGQKYAEDENDPNYAGHVTFYPIFGYKDGVVHEILKQGHKKAQIVLSHPVMETYLHLHSKKLSPLFFLSFVLYLLFAIFYSSYQICILFYRNNENDSFTFINGCDSGSGGIECGLAVVVLVLFLLLLLEELLQVLVFRWRYYKRADAWNRQATYVLIILGLFFQHELSIQKYLSLVSLPLIWLGVIYRSTYNGSTISAMFLHILHKRFMGGFYLTLTLSMTFGTAFLVLSRDATQESQKLTFADGIAAFFRPLLMLLGEYEYLTVIEPYAGDQTQYSNTEMVIVSILVTALALIGTLVLINLLLALIVSDVNHLYQLSRRKELFRMARQLVLFEYLAKFSCFERKTGSDAFEEMVVRVCLHDHCNDRCFATKIKDNQIKLRLRNLLRNLESGTDNHKRGSRPMTAGDGGVMNCVIDDIL